MIRFAVLILAILVATSAVDWNPLCYRVIAETAGGHLEPDEGNHKGDGHTNQTHLTSPMRLRLVKRASGSQCNEAQITFRNVGFPGGRQTFFAAPNSLIRGRNLYAPNLVRTAQGWRCYYGGWNDDGQVNDLIYLSTVRGLDTSKAWSPPQVIIMNGIYEHVNDPTVVIDDGTHHMLYTAAKWTTDPPFGTYFRDWINYSTSTDGVNWSPNAGTQAAEITLCDPRRLADGTITSIARPSLVRTDTGWKLWFDGNAQGQPGGAMHSYLAESVGNSPTSFQIVHRYPDIAGGPGFFEPDVVLRAGGTYLAVVQRGFSQLYLAISPDGIHFDFQGPVLEVAHPLYLRERVSNPGLIYDRVKDENHGVAFGMAGTPLTDHDIGFAYSQYIVQVRSQSKSPGGQPVWHTFARSGQMGEQLVSVFEFDRFDFVRIIDPTTGSIVLQQAFDKARAGDVWELVRGD